MSRDPQQDLLLFPEQPFIPDWKAQAKTRHTDPETSREAADSVHDIRESQQLILALFKKFGPMSDSELTHHVYQSQNHISPSGIRTRRSELVALGLVRHSGRTEKLASGRNSIVWEAV